MVVKGLVKYAYSERDPGKQNCVSLGPRMGCGGPGRPSGTERRESAPVCAHYNPVEIRRSCSDGTCLRLVDRGVLAGVVSPALQALRGRRAMRVLAAHQRGGLRRQLRHEGLDQGIHPSSEKLISQCRNDTVFNVKTDVKTDLTSD